MGKKPSESELAATLRRSMKASVGLLPDWLEVLPPRRSEGLMLLEFRARDFYCHSALSLQELATKRPRAIQALVRSGVKRAMLNLSEFLKIYAEQLENAANDKGRG